MTLVLLFKLWRELMSESVYKLTPSGAENMSSVSGKRVFVDRTYPEEPTCTSFLIDDIADRAMFCYILQL